MESFFTGNSDQKIFLYNSDNFIYLRSATGSEISRAILLCNDFDNSLSKVIFHNSIHFAYQNLLGDLIVRNIMDPNILFRLSAEGTPDCVFPTLYTFHNTLLLSYFMKNPLDGTLIFHMIDPISQTKILCDPICFSAPPQIQTVTLTDSLLIICKNAETYRMFQLDPMLNLSPFLLSSQNTAEMQNTIYSLQQTIEKKDRIITSIKQQYDELMQTAVKYKDEASKWYHKYYSRK